METKNKSTEAIDLRLEVVRSFDAPRELVWKAWTEPEHVKQWMYPHEGQKTEQIRFELRVGGRFRIQMRAADGEYFTVAGKYLEVKPLERLVYTWDWEKEGSGTEFGELEGNESQVTVEFKSRGNQTELILTHEKFASVEARNRHKEGWSTLIEKMAKYIEKISAN